MSRRKRQCERCGAPALVHISNDSGQGDAFRHLCLDCADAEDAGVLQVEAGLNLAAVLMVVGLMVLVMSAAADYLRFGYAEGFGIWQRLGMLLGAGGVLMGALTRTSTILVIGLITGVVTLLADWLGFGNTEGFGIQQLSGCMLGAVLIVTGALIGRAQGQAG